MLQERKGVARMSGFWTQAMPVTQYDASRVFERYRHLLDTHPDAEAEPDKIKKRMRILEHVMDDTEVIPNSGTVNESMAIVMAFCALGPVNDGPPPDRLLNSVISGLPSPFEALQLCYANMEKGRRWIESWEELRRRRDCTKRQSRRVLTPEVAKRRDERLSNVQRKLNLARERLAAARERNPALDVATYVGLIGKSREGAASPWDDWWELAAERLGRQVKMACARTDRFLRLWLLRRARQAPELPDRIAPDQAGEIADEIDEIEAAHLRGEDWLPGSAQAGSAWSAAGLAPADAYFIDGPIAPAAAREIVGRLTRPPVDKYTVSSACPLTMSFSPMPVLDGPIPPAGTGSCFEAAWDSAGTVINQGDLQIAMLRPECRFVFSVDAPLVSKGDVRLAAHTRIVCRSGDREAFVGGPRHLANSMPNAGSDVRGVRLVETRSTVNLAPLPSAMITTSVCNCGAEKCEEQHSLARWSATSLRYVSLVDFVFNAVKGPLAKRRHKPTQDRLDVASNALKQGMYYPLLASGWGLGKGQPPIRHVRCALFLCSDPRCRTDHRDHGRESPGESACSSEPMDNSRQKIRIVQSVQFVSLSYGRYALRPYWGPKDNLKPETRTDRDVLDHVAFADFVKHFGFAPLETAATWHARIDEKNALLKLLPAHLIEHAPDWAKLKPDDKWDWLLDATEAREAYAQLVRSFLQAVPAAIREDAAVRWQRLETYVESHPWFYLLTHGSPSHVRSLDPLLLYQQINLICTETGSSEGNRQPPKFLWTKEA
jgi:hypothetical protein